MMKRFGFLFLLCLSVIGSIRAEEKLLYSTTFQDWESSSASDDAVVVPAKTHFSNEDFSFSLSQVVVSPTGTDSKFSRFTHYMYRMKTTSNKLITNIL